MLYHCTRFLKSRPCRGYRCASTIPRRKPFTLPTAQHVAQLRDIASTLSTLDGSAQAGELDGYTQDWMNKYKGNGQIVVKPKTTQELSQVLRYCYDNGLATVPQGGNTGLVGGSIPIHDEIIVSLASLNNVRSFDPVSGILVADAGVVLEAADAYLAQRGFIFPLDLGAKGSCHIGGNVATNAGGLRLLRYGSLHGSVLGLEVVLPNGDVWDGLSSLRKDNTGYDLKQLFIGSEGSIGIISAISILCPRRPVAMNVAVFSVPSYEGVQNVFFEAKLRLGEILSAFEFFDRQCFSLVKVHVAHAHRTFDVESDFFCLIETSGSHEVHDQEKLSALLGHLLTSGLVQDGVLSQDETQFRKLWQLRESAAEAAGKTGSVYKYDVSVPVPRMYNLVEDMRRRLRELGVLEGDGTERGPIRAVAGYGHIGDGNLHINIVADKYSSDIEAAIEPYIYELVAAEKGSISAEHGLGMMKAPHVGYSKSEESIAMMRRIKKMFDPKGLMNPYKYIE